MTDTAILSLCVPTWNRSDKLRRTLQELVAQRREYGFERMVNIVVSDNGSTDNTPEVCSEFEHEVSIYRHASNVGFDQNCLSLFSKVTTPYIIFFSDDDVPSDDMLPAILVLLQEYEPAVLLFSFIQHPFDEHNTSLPINEDLRSEGDIATVLRMLIHYPKLSPYCIRRTAFTAQILKEIGESKDDTGYLFVGLAAKAFLMERQREILLHRRPLASADTEARNSFRFSPLVAARRRRAVDFPEFREECPEVLNSLDDDEFRAMLMGFYQQEVGAIDFAPNIRVEMRLYLWRNRLKLVNPRYYRIIMLVGGAMVSRQLGLVSPFLALVKYLSSLRT